MLFEKGYINGPKQTLTQFTPKKRNQLVGLMLDYIVKKNQVESTFIKIINTKKTKIVVGCIYKHLNMDVLEFNNHLNQMLGKVSKEQKQIFLLEDFNINLLNYNVHQPTKAFLDSLASNSIIPYILQPTRLSSHSETLTDNIFSNTLSSEIISGNLTATISDHLPVFICP